jgi:tellurite methyltransferase
VSEPTRDPPSRLLLRFLPELRAAARLGPVVDLACGRGRNAIAIAQAGTGVIGIDRDRGFLAELQAVAAAGSLPVALARADLESPAGPPLARRSCGAIAVFRFLHRPLCAELVEVLRPGGLLLYETFTLYQRELGHGPGNPAFLLLPDELPQLFPGLEVLSHWEGVLPGPRSFALAQLAARRPL